MFKSALVGGRKDSTEELQKFALWGVAVTSTIQRDYAESNEILHNLKKFALSYLEQRALGYWKVRNRIGLFGEMGLGEILEGLRCGQPSWQLFDLYARSASFDRLTAIQLLNSWGLGRDGTYSAEKWRMRLGLGARGEEADIFKYGAFGLDYHSMLTFLDRYGVKRFLKEWSQAGGGVPHTSEVLASLALYSARAGGPERFSTLYTADRIAHLGRLELSEAEREDLVLESISSELGVRDFNTSDFGGRTYTLNLSGKEQFGNLERKVRDCVFDSKERLLGVIAPWVPPEVSELKTWFSASFSSGGSNISPHLHTAGRHKTYYFTVVFYAQVPAEMKKGEGDLIFLDTDIADPQYQKTPVTNRVRVSTGDLYAFPPLFLSRYDALTHPAGPINLQF